MIIVKDCSIEKIIYKAFVKLYKSSKLVTDPEILKEEPAVLILKYDKNSPDTVIDISNNIVNSRFDYKLFFPWLKSDKINIELDYWGELLLSTNLILILGNHLQNHKNSRRAIFNMWHDTFLEDLDKGAACITQIYFRIKGNKLEMHTHARANDVYECMLLDLHIMQYIHYSVSKMINLKLGEHLHFIDSMQLYKKNYIEIDKQYKYMIQNKSIWRNLFI